MAPTSLDQLDNMEVWEGIVECIYMDLDGVMINSILAVGDPTNAWKGRRQ